MFKRNVECSHSPGMEWNKIEWSGKKGMERNLMELNGKVWKWNGME